MREDSPPMFLEPKSLLNSSVRPSRRPAMRARSRLLLMLPPPSSTRMANMISTSRTPTPILQNGSLASSSQTSTSATLRSTPSSLSRIPSIKTIGRLGPTSTLRVASKSSAMTLRSQTPSVSRLLSRRKLATVSCSRSTRSGRSPSPSRRKF